MSPVLLYFTPIDVAFLETRTFIHRMVFNPLIIFLVKPDVHVIKSLVFSLSRFSSVH